MHKITQAMHFRLSLIQYAHKYGVIKAAIKYKTNRQYVYRRLRRYDGSVDSLRDRSRRPHTHPNQHTPEEIKLISDMRRRNPAADLIVFWVKLTQRSCSHSISGFYRLLRRQVLMALSILFRTLLPQLKSYSRRDYNAFPMRRSSSSKSSRIVLAGKSKRRQLLTFPCARINWALFSSKTILRKVYLCSSR